jgi:hypothetical protein
VSGSTVGCFEPNLATQKVDPDTRSLRSLLRDDILRTHSPPSLLRDDILGTHSPRTLPRVTECTKGQLRTELTLRPHDCSRLAQGIRAMMRTLCPSLIAGCSCDVTRAVAP